MTLYGGDNDRYAWAQQRLPPRLAARGIPPPKERRSQMEQPLFAGATSIVESEISE
jgi:hypothetical protein